MKNKSGAMLLLLLFLFLFRIVFCQSQLEWSTNYTIKVNEDGSARWIIERKALLETDYDEATFSYYGSLEYHNELSKNINMLVKEACLKTDRWNMTAGPLTIRVFTFRTATGSYGIIEYQYDWIGFADPFDDKPITIGDIFVEGIFLFGDGALIIEYPSGYDAHAFPPPDDPEKLMWYEIKNLGVGEPRVVLEKRTPSIMDILQEYALVISIFALAGTGAAFLWLFRFRKKEKEEVISPVPRLPLEIEDEEDKVVRLLKAAGGRLFQSTISKQCGFSKSKASILLTAMEKKGIVRRQKKGRERLVTLTDEREGMKRGKPN